MKLFLVVILAISLNSWAENIVINNPKGGWRDSSGKNVKYVQAVQYPDVRVSTPEDQPDVGVIAGKIVGDIGRNEKPMLLIVNGSPMPLKTSGNVFERPYSFGNGPNSIEIRSSDRKSVAKTQFYDVKTGGTPTRIRVTLSWDSDSTDLDLHVVTPNGEHCSYAHRLLQDGSALDVDVTTGYGPEIFSSPGVQKGPYLVYVNYYGRSSKNEITLVTVNIVTREGTVDEKVMTKRVPLRNPGELMFVDSFVY